MQLIHFLSNRRFLFSLASILFFSSLSFAQGAPDAMFIVQYGDNQFGQTGPGSWDQDFSSGNMTRRYSGSISETSVSANMTGGTTGLASGINGTDYSIQVLVRGQPSVTVTTNVSGTATASTSGTASVGGSVNGLPYGVPSASAQAPSGPSSDSVSDSDTIFADLGCGSGTISFPEYPGVFYSTIPGAPISTPNTSWFANGTQQDSITVTTNASISMSVEIGADVPTALVSAPEVNGVPVSKAFVGETVDFYDDGSFDSDNDPSGTPGPGAGICSRSWTLIAPNGSETSGGGSSSFSFIPNVRGEYTVRLEVIDNEGDTNTAEGTIVIDPPEPEGGFCKAGTGMSKEFINSAGPNMSSVSGPTLLSGIVPTTGNSFVIYRDPVSTRGYPLTVDISINSQSYFPPLLTQMGNARFTYSIRGAFLWKDGLQYAVILDADGQELNYGVFPSPLIPEPGIFSTLTIGATTYTIDGAGPPGRLDEAGNYSYLFDLNANRLLSVTDPQGNVQQIQYDANWDPTAVLDLSSGRSITFEYDTPGLIARIVEGGGTAVTHLTYTGAKLLDSITLKDANQNVIREVSMTYNSLKLISQYIIGNDPTSAVNFTYQHAGDGVYFANFTRADGSGSNLEYFEVPNGGAQYTAKRSNAQGGSTTLDIGVARRLVQRVSPAYNGASSGPVETFVYTPDRQLQSYSDGATTIDYTYNALGKVLTAQVSGGQALTRAYAGNGIDVLSVSDQEGTYLTYAYGDANNPHLPTSIGDGQGNTWGYSYNVPGQPLVLTPPAGSQQGAAVYTYEENASNSDFGYLRSETNGAGDLTSFTFYSPLGDLLSYATHPNFPLFDQAGFEYDAQRRVTKAWFFDGGEINYAYDDHFLQSIVDEAGNITTYEYEKSSGLLEKVNMPLGKSLEIDHNGDLAVSEFIDAQANQTVFSYGDAGELTQESYPDGHSRDYLYDDFGRLSQIQNSAGHEQTLSYDSAGRITQVDFANPTQGSVSSSYHPDGRPQVVTHEAGTETYTYDSSRRVQTISRDFSASGLTRIQLLEYTYYPDDRIQSLTWKDNGGTVMVWNYAYDAAGRLQTVSNNLGDSAAYVYDGEGKIISQTNSNGTVTEYTYSEPRNRVATITHKSGGTPFETFSLTYDNGLQSVGNIIQVTELDGSTVSYSYDDLYRLTSETRIGTNPFANTFAYDLAGNVTTLNGGTFATYDTANKIATVPGGSVGYDGIGNTLSVSGTGLTSATYSWGTRSELRSQQQTGGGLVDYLYDASKRRVYREQGGLGRWFIFSQGVLIGEVLPTNAVVAYTWGADGLVSGRAVGFPVTRFYHYGPQGENRYATDGGGAVADTYLYDAYGSLVNQTGGMFTPHKYGGKYGYYTDPVIETVLATWRWYSPQLMRWLSRDPIDYEGGDNVYAYVVGNPVKDVDPSGLDVRVCLYAQFESTPGVDHIGIGTLYTPNYTEGFYPIGPTGIGPIGEIRRDLPDGSHHVECVYFDTKDKQDRCVTKCVREFNASLYHPLLRNCTQPVSCLEKCGVTSLSFPHTLYDKAFPRLLMKQLRIVSAP